MAHAAAAARPSSMSIVVGLALRATERRREGAANSDEEGEKEGGARGTREGADVVAALGRRNAPPAVAARAAPPRADIARTAAQREGSTLRVCDASGKRESAFFVWLQGLWSALLLGWRAWSWTRWACVWCDMGKRLARFRVCDVCRGKSLRRAGKDPGERVKEREKSLQKSGPHEIHQRRKQSRASAVTRPSSSTTTNHLAERCNTRPKGRTS